jgi:hypothetical protein
MNKLSPLLIWEVVMRATAGQRIVRERLRSLPAYLNPIKKYALKYLRCCATMEESENGRIILIGHLSGLGPNSYLIELYPPANPSEIRRYEKSRRVVIHPMVREILTHINGSFYFGAESLFAPSLSLFGMASSMARAIPELDRDIRMCHDLSLANLDWINGFAIPNGLFYFAGGPHSASENIGYFVDKDRQILAIRKNGKIVAKWGRLERFLDDELHRAENRIKGLIAKYL